jgi:predicted dehydrogenase
LAAELGIRAFARFDEMLAAVDAVSFSVSPDVQPELALRTTEAGKHVLLEKPIATTRADADRLVEAVERRGVSALSFLTRLFVDGANDLIARARAAGHTHGEASWSSRALLPGTPFTDSPWRNGEYGTLWDLGPHVLSILVPVLGPVTHIAASRVRKAKFTCRIRHAGGRESVVAIDPMDESLPRGSFEHFVFSGGEGETRGGPFTVEPVLNFTAAVRLLIESVGVAGGAPGPNVRHGRDIVAALEAACTSMQSGGGSIEVSR